MILLAIETATIEVGVAVVGDGGPLAWGALRPGRRHVETLHPLIAETLARAGRSLGEVDAVAVDVGPGLFTGLRVGVAAAKSLAFGLGSDLVALESTEVLLHAVSWHPGLVAAVVDLRRGEVAWALSTTGGRPGTGRPPERGRPEDLALAIATALADGGGGPALLVGDGARRYHAEITASLELAGAPEPVIAGDDLAAPPAPVLGDLALARLREGRTADPFAVEPCYLRDAEVRIGWATRDALAAGGR